jgi:hypothetical protein
MRHPITLPPTSSPVQVIRVVVPDTGAPLAIFNDDGVELVTQCAPCLQRGRPTVELCAIGFAGPEGFRGFEYGPATEAVQAPARARQCQPADPLTAWSRTMIGFTFAPTGGAAKFAPVTLTKVVEEGPVRVTFAHESKLSGLRLIVEATVYHGLPFAHFDVTLANSEAQPSPGDVDFTSLSFTGPNGSTVIALDSQGVDGFVMPEPGVPTMDWMWTRGTGTVRLTPKSSAPLTIHQASEWSCSFLLVPTHLATHPAIEAFVESPGFAGLETGPLFVDGIASPGTSALDAVPVVEAATSAARKAIDAYLAERAAGVKHSGAFPAGPSTDARGSGVGNDLRHPLGQRDGGPTGSLAADPRSYEAHLLAGHPRIERYLREQEHGMFDRARYSLERDGAPFEPKGSEKLILQRTPPGDPFTRASEAPAGWFEAPSSARPHTHGSPDGQHYWLNGVVVRRVETTNARSARRRLEVLADAAHAHGPDPRKLLRGPKLGTVIGRDEGWRLDVILSRYAMRPNERDATWIRRMIETAVVGQTPFGNVRMDDFSKEFAGSDSTYGRDTIAKRRGIAIEKVPKLAGTSVYQESIFHCATEEAVDLGFDVPWAFREALFDFIWHRSVTEGAHSPWYRVAVWLPGVPGSIGLDVEPAAPTTSDFNAQHSLAYGLLRGYAGADAALRRYCFDANPRGWLSSGKADKFANRGALLTALDLAGY